MAGRPHCKNLATCRLGKKGRCSCDPTLRAHMKAIGQRPDVRAKIAAASRRNWGGADVRAEQGERKRRWWAEVKRQRGQGEVL